MGAYGGTVEASKTPGTGITYPGMVKNLQLQGGYKQIELTWEEPNDTGGLDITAFKIYRGPASDILSEYTQVPGAEFSFTDSDVENDIDYYYAVSAVNDFGEGQQTTPIGITATWFISDLNRDGLVNLLDWSIFCREWFLKSPWHNL